MPKKAQCVHYGNTVWPRIRNKGQESGVHGSLPNGESH
jgi:hypothetical protein